MKGYILEANLEGQGWSSRLFTILLILTWELRYPQKRGVNRKRGGRGILEVVLPGQGEWLTLGNEGVTWGTKGKGKQYRLTIK